MYLFCGAIGRISWGLRNEIEPASVNGLSMFKSFKFLLYIYPWDIREPWSWESKTIIRHNKRGQIKTFELKNDRSTKASTTCRGTAGVTVYLAPPPPPPLAACPPGARYPGISCPPPRPRQLAPTPENLANSIQNDIHFFYNKFI